MSKTYITDFTDLRVWQLAMEIVELVYRNTENFPAREQYGLTSQIRRCAVSAPSNIAEGYARRHMGDYLRHISIAQGSLAELHTQVEIARRLSYTTESAAREIIVKIENLRRQLHALRDSLSRSDQVKERSAEEAYSCKDITAPACGPAEPGT